MSNSSKLWVIESLTRMFATGTACSAASDDKDHGERIRPQGGQSLDGHVFAHGIVLLGRADFTVAGGGRKAGV